MSELMRNLTALADMGYEDKSLGEIIDRLRSLHTIYYSSPITVEMSELNGYGDMDEPQRIGSHEAVKFGPEIMQRIHSDVLSDCERARGLAVWMDRDSTLSRKVWSIKPVVSILKHELVGVAVAELMEELTAEEEVELLNYIEGQYSDGWGEEFEQREIRAGGFGDRADLFVSFWRPDNWKIERVEKEVLA